MITSSAVPLRAQIRRKAPVALVATTLALTLAVPTASFAAPAAPATVAAAPVDAAPALVRGAVKTAKPKLKIKRSSSRQVRGETRVKLTVRAKHKGKKVAGKVEFRVGKKVLKTKKLKKGKVSYKLPKKLKKGTNKIRVIYRPTRKAASPTANRKALSTTSRTVRVKVISQSRAKIGRAHV